MKAFWNVLSVALLLLSLSGCATFTGRYIDAEGAKASAACTAGGPGGLSGIGPGGIVAGAKVNEDFKGTVSVFKDCSIGIESF